MYLVLVIYDFLGRQYILIKPNEISIFKLCIHLFAEKPYTVTQKVGSIIKRKITTVSFK